MIQQGLLRGFVEQKDFRDFLRNLLNGIGHEERLRGFVEEGRLAVGAVSADEGSERSLVEVLGPGRVLGIRGEDSCAANWESGKFRRQINGKVVLPRLEPDRGRGELLREDARVPVWKSTSESGYPENYSRLAISAPRPSERPKLGHDLREIQSTAWTEQHLTPTARDPRLKGA